MTHVTHTWYIGTIYWHYTCTYKYMHMDMDMYVCMCICICMYVCMYVCIYIYIYIYNIHTYTHCIICMYYKYAYMHACMHTSIRAYVHTCIHAYVIVILWWTTQAESHLLQYLKLEALNIYRFGSVRKHIFPGSTRFGLRFSDASWLGPVRSGSLPRPVPAGSRINRFGSVRFGRFGSVSYSVLQIHLRSLFRR